VILPHFPSAHPKIGPMCLRACARGRSKRALSPAAPSVRRASRASRKQGSSTSRSSPPPCPLPPAAPDARAVAAGADAPPRSRPTVCSKCIRTGTWMVAPHPSCSTPSSFSTGGWSTSTSGGRHSTPCTSPRRWCLASGPCRVTSRPHGTSTDVGGCTCRALPMKLASPRGGFPRDSLGAGQLSALAN
jgi:hypothetical protein